MTEYKWCEHFKLNFRRFKNAANRYSGQPTDENEEIPKEGDV